MEEQIPKKVDWGKRAGWILTTLLLIWILTSAFRGEYRKWKIRLMQEGAQVQQQQINQFIINQLKDTGALRIVLNGNDGKTQEIVLRPVLPETEINTVSTTP